MKLLYTRKQFQGEMEKALAPLKQENENLRDKIAKKEFRYLDESSMLKDQIDNLLQALDEKDNLIAKQQDIIKKLTKDNKLYFGAKGGLTKYNNRLKKELKQVKEELNEANEKLSQRYIVKELEPVKVKNTQVMKTKSGARTSMIIKKVVENEKN